MTEIGLQSDLRKISGPYSPIYRDYWKGTEILHCREDWWGAGANLYSDLPNWEYYPPKYVGHISYLASSSPIILYLTGQIDLYGGYIKDLQD